MNEFDLGFEDRVIEHEHHLFWGAHQIPAVPFNPLDPSVTSMQCLEFRDPSQVWDLDIS